MRRITFLILALFAKIGAQEANAFVEIDRQDYSITFPSEWDVGAGWTDEDVTALSPSERPDDIFHENVTVLVDDQIGNLSLDQYYASSLDGLKKLATDFHLEDQGDIEIGGNQARYLIFTHRAGIYTFRVLQYILVEDQKAYLITCTATVDSYAKFEPEFKQIAQSFRLHLPTQTDASTKQQKQASLSETSKKARHVVRSSH